MGQCLVPNDARAEKQVHYQYDGDPDSVLHLKRKGQVEYEPLGSAQLSGNLFIAGRLLYGLNTLEKKPT